MNNYYHDKRYNYKNINRKLTIEYVNQFPYEIVGWTEEYLSGFGKDAVQQITEAAKKKTILIDYWNRHDPPDEIIRKELGI